MNLNTERSNMNGQSSHSGHSFTPSPPRRKEELLHPNPQHRPHAARVPSYNHYRLSHAPSPHHFHRVNDAMAYRPRDPSRVSNRYSIGHQIGPDVFRRSYSDNVPSMLPSHSSFQSFTTRDQKRATLQSNPNLADLRPGNNPNRASRVPDMPKRPSAEPANLIHSIRDSPFTNKPKTVEVNSKRVVTGILQSALPLSARPPPVDTTPARSMPIAELEKRHKAALQKLQTHTNQLAAKSSTPKSSTSSQPKPVKPPQRPTIQVKPEFSSDVSSKSETADKSGKTAGKNSSYRRSFFSFLIPKEDTKSNSSSEEPVQSKKSSSSKKHKVVRKVASDRGEEEDEDVPLAQLRDRRASYNPASQTGSSVRQSKNFEPLNSQVLKKSFSVPANVNKLQDGRDSLHPDYNSADESHSQGTDQIHHSKYARSKTHSGGNRSNRASTHLESTGGFHSMDKQPILTTSENLTPGLNNSSSWLQANFELSNDEKNGPRPLIFEDEAKAIRNSKRLWVQ